MTTYIKRPNYAPAKLTRLIIIIIIIVLFFLISDIMMPKMNGLELCKTLKTDFSTSHIPIILLRARGSNTFQIEGFEYGTDDYIIKPFNIELFSARIKNLLDTRKTL